MRRCDVFLSLLLGGTLLLGGFLAHGHWRQSREPDARASTRELVRRLQLTDLALFTEARYTRHLSQADHYAPFQNHPLALEHFPSGSLLSPPEHSGRRP